MEKATQSPFSSLQARQMYDEPSDENILMALMEHEALRCCGCGKPTPVAGVRFFSGEHNCQHAYCHSCIEKNVCTCGYNGMCIASISAFLDIHSLRQDGTVIIVPKKEKD